MSQVTVRLMLADNGEFHTQTISVPAKSLEGYERLIDALREDPEILRSHYVDHARLASASIVGDAPIGA